MKKVIIAVALAIGIAAGPAVTQSSESNANTDWNGIANDTEGGVSCTIFPPAQVVPGQPFDVRVSRVPGYPGSWFSPTVRLKIRYPTEPGWSYEQDVKKTIPKIGAIRTDFSLLAPYSIYPDPQAGFVAGGTVSMLAVVLEPTTGGTRRTICTASTIISP